MAACGVDGWQLVVCVDGWQLVVCVDGSSRMRVLSDTADSELLPQTFGR